MVAPMLYIPQLRALTEAKPCYAAPYVAVQNVATTPPTGRSKTQSVNSSILHCWVRMK